MKTELVRYLQQGRDVLLWKLEGLSEYDIRRPMVPTGTSLLGLVKHVATTEMLYFGECFGREFPEPVAWAGDDMADMFATAEESREFIVDFYERVWAFSDQTILQLDLDSPGTVRWWPEERRHVTLGWILIHMINETARHAGHADILREQIDGAAGFRPDVVNMPDSYNWKEKFERLEQIAREAS
jgi:uncharacterized damage-inducible protein DinB